MTAKKLKQKLESAGRKIVDKVDSVLESTPAFLCQPDVAEHPLADMYSVDMGTVKAVGQVASVFYALGVPVVIRPDVDDQSIYFLPSPEPSPELTALEQSLERVESEIDARARTLRDVVFGVLNPDSERFCDETLADGSDLSIPLIGLVHYRNECRKRIAALKNGDPK